MGTHRDRGAPGLPVDDLAAAEETTEEALPFEDGIGGATPRAGVIAGESGREPPCDLAGAPAPAVLHGLYARAASGALLLARGSVKKVVYLRDGYPVAVKSNVVGECLGKILAWEGLISEEQYRRSLQAMREGGIRQGSALIRMGALTHQELAKGLELQLRFKICETFAWTDGTSQLFPGVDPPYESLPMSVSPAALLHEGVRSFMPQATVLSTLRPSVDKYLVPSNDPLMRFQDVGATPAIEQVLALVDGRATLSELMRSSPLPVRETSALAYTLLVARIVALRAEPARTAAPLFDPDVAPDPPTDRTSGGDSAQRVDLARLVARLRSASHHEALGIAPGAPPHEVQRAYHERALERHPDRVGASGGAGIRALAETALALTAEAYAVVSGQAVSGLPQRAADSAEAAIDARVRDIVEAEGHHQAGLDLLDQGRAAEAAALLGRAVELCEEEGDFRASYAWALFQTGLDQESAAQALVLLDEAILRSPGLVRGHILRGHVLRFLDREDESARAFEEALRRAPDNEEARSELARIRESTFVLGD